ncbi:hypothetical protein PoB_005350800 [Plakobranchus ocellatus]|uniref:DNA-directed DNA polymerase n=1 Tax=Plakobranchus ocellatus TaxID=259542 RepID=A0AAV4C6B1_9GAST|nr:hypothetical protein PoB_005350800 [Plakobranchus ocellatus]
MKLLISSRYIYPSHLPHSQTHRLKQKCLSFEIFATVISTAWSDVISKCLSRREATLARCLLFFKNIDVSSEDIGPFMRDFADEHKLLGRPRRTLIGSFIGKNIFLATPLLRWYLEHGLVIDEIYEVVEYTPARCFQGFADIVSGNRRRGDLDPTKAILTETFKLLGNSAYGKSLENLENRRDVAYSMGRDVGKLVNSRLFRTCTPLDHNDLFEVESAKSKVRWNFPCKSDFSFINTLNYTCYSSIMTLWTSSCPEMTTSSVRWTRTRCIWRFPATLLKRW